MKSIISSSVRNTRYSRGSTVCRDLLRRGVSTQELDVTKGGEFVILPAISLDIDILQVENV
jgi:hypothetical protein